LLRDHNVQIKIAQIIPDQKQLKVAAHQQLLHIAIKVAHHVQVDPVVQADPANVQELVERSVKVAERRRITRVRKRFVKRLTIWRPQQLAAP
jgi:hypothetical protein